MTPERWQQVENIFQAALERDGSERARYLRESCAGDIELQEEVESLLVQEQRTASFLQKPAMEVAARAMASEVVSLRGRQLGSYSVLEQIGAGGMGEVYLAKDSKLKREVALKVLPASFAKDPERLSRFRREAQLLASLKHPNIGVIHGLEESDGIHFLVLELVEGETLAERIARSGPLPVAEVLAISKQVAEALEAAHKKGITHRDIKPANIKVTPDRQVKVLDFGLAKAFASDSSDLPTLSAMPTEDGRILGTPAYMSPEQAQGKQVDKQTDIWAFGCVLYELLTGQRPFPGENLSQIIAAVLRSEPDWQKLPEETPITIRTLLRRCLQKDVNRRFHSAADVALEIEEAIATPTALTALAPIGGKPRTGNRIAWSLVALLAASVISLVFWNQQEPVPDVQRFTAGAVATQITNYGDSETFGAIAPDGKSFAFVSDHGETEDLWVRKISGGEPVRLTNDAAVEEDLVYSTDGESIYYTRTDESGRAIWRLGSLGGQARRVLNNARMPAPSPDGRNLAYLTLGSPISIEMITLEGQDRRVLVPAIPPGDPSLTWSPDGNWVSYNQPGLFTPHNLILIDVASGQTRQATQFTSSSEGIVRHTWLPDNRHVAVSYVPRSRQLFSEELGILDIENGIISRMTMRVGRRFGVVRASADGSRLLATTYEDEDEVWKVPLGGDPDANGRAAVRLLDSIYDPFWTFVSRDGSTLLFNGFFTGSRNLWTMPLDGSAPPRQVTMLEGSSIMHSSLSPDGDRVAFASSQSGGSDIWTQNVDGSDLRQLTNDAAADYWPVWSPDGRSIVFGSERGGSRDTWLIPATGGPAEKVMDGFFRGDWILNPKGSGSLLVSTAGDGIRLLDFESRKVLWERPLSGTGFSLPLFSPDAKYISLPIAESDGRETIWIFDVASGQRKLAVRFPEPPRQTFFRAAWVDAGRAFVVNRMKRVSHIVMFDHFWSANSGQQR